MALFFRDDPSYDLNRQLTGFNRYRQLLSFYGFRWFRVNLMTVVGFAPLAAGITLALMTSSLAVLLPVSILGGMLFGPFLAGMFDAVMRGLRDAPGIWWNHYKKSWKQNWKGSLLPGAVFGLVCGLYTFALYIFWRTQRMPSPGTLALLTVSLLLFFVLSTLYWPQLVLFQQRLPIRLKNIVLFNIKHFWRMLGVAVLELGYLLVYLLFAPWTLVLAPLLGFWFIIFLSQLAIYRDFNADFRVEEQLYAIEGDPWRVSAIDIVEEVEES